MPIVEVYYHLWSKPDSTIEVRVLLDNDRRCVDADKLYCLTAGHLRLFFYHIGLPVDDGFIASWAVKVWLTHYPNMDVKTVYFSKVLTEGNVQ